MDGVLRELNHAVPEGLHLVRISLRLAVALFIGTVIGLQRELTHKTAGLRTHMLLALGTGLFIVSAQEAGLDHGDLSRIVQGIVTGIGFLGGGAILKLAPEREVHGMTTAAGIWMTTGASAAAALGMIGVALVGTAFGLAVLIIFHKLEKRLGHHARHDREDAPPRNPGTEA